jgi:two-component system, NarL family, invasion response regulator UvrY
VIVVTEPNSEQRAKRTATEPVTVLVVDDQAVFRQVAVRLIAATPGFRQVGEASSGPDAVRLTAELHPDLVLLDVRMPGMDGLDVARRLLADHPGVVVALVSSAPLPELPRALLTGGTVVHLRKQDLSPRALMAAWGVRDHREP